MSLVVATDVLADALREDDDPEELEFLMKELWAINQLLVGAGLPMHQESATRGSARKRSRIISVPYGFVHHLRRAYARAYRYPDAVMEPVREGEDPARDTDVELLSMRSKSHLLCHSDSEGYYVPIDFDDVLVPGQEHDIPGGTVGSSQALLRELAYVAPYLGIGLIDGKLTDAEIERLHGEFDGHPLFKERASWLLFHEAARVSVANGTVMMFC